MLLYNILRFFLYGIIAVTLIFRRKGRNFFRKRLSQKIENKEFEEDDILLVHMSSVGEFNLSRELIESLLRKGEKLIVSIMTDTGFEEVRKVYGNNLNVKIIYFPLDDYFLLRKLYKEYKIRKTVIIETEIWPNLYYTASKNGELFIVNGRLTEKRLKSYLKVKWLIRRMLNLAKKVMVQSEEDKERYERAGVRKEKIIVHKNLKYSIQYERLDNEKRREYFRNSVLEDRKKIVCGSTRSGEEEIWLNVFKEINRDSGYQLIIVPRHLDRIEEIRNEVEEIFGKSYKNSSLLSESRKTDIIIVDKMGVLRDFYQLADFVFVGGTLVDIGGHSILEPLYYGKLPIIGEYYQNIEEIVKDALKMEFVKIVKNIDEIIEYLKKSEMADTQEFFEKNNEIGKIMKELYN